eukprot:TRINITY_DN20312_c0_g2_i5.p1 TRINITY_DN20312_c0_g2~~TRINITY_DN20312_c0_g2_i5.p1  ORF type:complete len:4212 (-),score=1387.32 TRINITY_DN20312_c0_g2_i5:193-12828(-)
MPSKNDGLAKVKPKSKSVATGKFANGSSATDLKAGDIDWRVFGLDLEPAPGQGGARGPAIPPPNPGGPMPFSPAAPDGGAARAPAGRRTPPGMKLGPLDGVKSQTSTLAYPAPQPFDTTDLSHLRSKAKRTQGYTDNLPPLQVLLEERGVDYSRPNPMRDVQLPLEAFEDTMMCTRQPSEWAALMRDPMTGEVVPLACRALKLMDDGSGRWQNGMVTVWDAESQRYIVRWSTGQEDKVLSLHVLFNGDDPILFADRLATALQNRRYANSLLKYHFFVDSMPEDKTRRIGRETATKIASKAKANMWNASSDFAEKLDKRLDQLVEEAQKEYLRVQNAITFEKVHNNGSLNSLPVDLQLPPEEEKPTVPYLAVKVLPRYEVWMGPPDPLLPRGFGQAFEWFCQASLLIRPEVCAALQVTRGMCLDLLTERVFETAFLSPMRNSEFQERQEGSIMRMKGRLGMWVNTIRMRVTQSLQQAQEKWFQLNETSLENYRASRLRLLLVTCRLMMSNAFLVLADANLNQFTSAVSDLVPLRVEIPEAGTKHPLKHIQHFVADPKAASGESIVEPLFKQTIFRMEVKIEEPEPPAPPVDDKKKGKDAAPPPPPKKAFAFLTQPEDFKQSMLNAFDQGITAFQDVHSVESVLLPHLIRDDHLDPNFRPSDKWVVDLRQQVADACDKHLPWLDQVLVLLDSYKDVVQLDPQASVDKMKAGDPTPANEVKRLIEDRQKRAKEIMEGIPDEKEPLPIGFYKLDTSSFRSPMVEKLELSVELMLKMLADQLDVDVRSATESFGDMFNQLKTEVSDIEGVSDMREYLKSIPGELSKLQGAINDAMSTTALIEDMRYMLPADTLDARWRMFGSPGDVKREMSKVEEYLDGKHKEYLSKQESEQVDFEKRLSELEAVIESFAAYQSLDQVTEVAAKVKSTTEEIKQCQDMVRLFNSREALFDRDSTDYSNLGSMVKVFEPFSNLWKTAGDWVENKESWLKGSFESIDPRYAEGEVVNGIRLLFKTIRTLKENEDTKAIVGIAEQIKVELEEFKPNLPLITGLRNEGMRDRHWEQVSKACGVQVGPTMEGGLTLQNLIDKGLLEYTQEVADVGDRAGKEFGLEKTLAKMKADWEPLLFDLSEKYRKTNTYILKGDGEAMALLDEQIVTTQAMMFSMFKGPFEEEIDEWNARLMRVSETLEEWLKCQRAWMYLQPIFDSDDIMRQLPTEGKRFKHVDSSWRQQMTYTRDNPKIIDVCAQEGLLETWRECNITLDMVQKGLEDYLETKRNGFARFYFLSNDELLEILSQTKDPTRVQPFLSKVFEAMSKVTFTSDNDITDMFSPEGEKITFGVPVVTYQKQVEVWMGDLENASCQAIRAAIHKGVETYQGMVRTEWVLANPGQIVLNSSQAHWTAEVEAAFHAGEIIQYGEKLAQQILDIVKLFDPKVNPAGLTKMQRTTIGALVVIDVHAKDIIQEFGRNGVVSAASFEWISQLRYYWQMDDRGTENLWVNCVQTSFPYGYEYLGNSMRLVITPLTDMCYITLMGAQALNLGGAPAGPAGTGKTETTKDLGKALAVPVVVFNCSDGLDYKIMGRFFSGLAQAGAWACFDEFNRIQVEVLSVIAQQMLTVTQAIRQRKDIFEFLGRDIPLNMRFGVYITMNPGYAGRAELPDNLKALFRPVAMMVPDYRLIAEIILYSEGFNGAPELARKMVSLYSLSSEQLSKQDHYDFGMRAVKSVLVMAGHLKRQNPDLPEDVTLIRALRDSNAPKFLSFDLPLFAGIITDLYPSVVIPDVDYGQLKIMIEAQLRLAELQIVPDFVTKITQLLETQLVRHGVMLVGLTMCGKSTDCVILSKTLTALKKEGSPDPAHQMTKIFNLNPKSITMDELYGSFNENTGEWKDGLVAILVREAVSDTSDNKKWVNFDGPVDAIWIENMNTVLDDNKMLCLSNGERIKLPPTMTIMFEVNDLQVASPATVSRCGMVYLEPVHLGWKPLIDTWAERFEKQYPRYAKDLRKWTTDICKDALPFIREECQEAPGIPTMNNNLVQGYLRMLTTFISTAHGFIPEGEGKQVRSEEDLDKLVRIYCAMSCFWSLGANLHESSRKKFMDFMRNRVSKFCSDIPDGCDFYLSCVNDEDVKIEPLDTIVQVFTFDPNESFFNILVPTAETTGQRLMLKNLMEAGFNCLFSGETGVGKSVGIQQFLNTAGELYSTGGANFSAQTSTTNVGDLFENRLERKRKNLLGAPPGTTMLFFVDDINMPMLETYGAQPPIELLRQVIDYGGFYDQKKLFWKNVADTQFIAACGPPGGGKMPVTPRLFRHFNMMWMPSLSESAMNRILSSILGGWLGSVQPTLRPLSSSLVKAAVDIFFRISEDLLPTPLKCHYTFNLRDPAKMIQGMMMISVKHSLQEEKDLINLFLHEASRQFRDRLIDDTDRDWFNNLLIKKVKEGMRKPINEEAFHGLVYGDFVDRGNKPYQQVESMEKCVEIFNEFLVDYNETNPSKMDIVFFEDACRHLARCSRVIKQPRGNVLMVGMSGVGRKCVGRMAAHMAELQCYSIEITRTYGPNEFKEDIKNMMMIVAKSGGKGLQFLFSDSQIVKESFLEDINNILNTGEVPNLFAADEMEQVIGAMRAVAKQAGRETRDGIWQYFVQVIRENLHIVLAFSPIGDGFRARCRQFPSIINCTTIDWYNAWPAEALYAVAERNYKQAPKELELEEILPKLADISQFMHSSSRVAAENFYDSLRRRTYMTPTSYLELIGLFTKLLQEKKGELQTKLQRYVVGSKTLKETKVVVDDLKVTLTKMQPGIEQAKKDTAELIIKVDADKAIANEKSAACAVDEKIAGEAAAEASAIAADCQRDLDEALPEYYHAIKALDSLDKKDIQEIKSFAKPPPLVEVVLSAVCLLLGAKENWDEAKKQMNDSNFLGKLKDYDKDALSANAKLTAKMQRYIKRDDFQPDVVQKVSKAACSLCMWVKAMEVYGRVAREIEPKKLMLKGAEDSRDAAQAKLAEKKKELKEVLDKVAALEMQLDAAQRQAQQLEADAEECVVKLNRAEKLLAGLGNESVRWVAASTILEKNLTFVIGNIILAGGFIAYTGPFTAEFRKDLTKQWLEKVQSLKLAVDPSWDIASVLVDPAEVREWNICSLPSDELSVENGIMVTRGRRWPLMIDPQGQANRWVRQMGKSKGIVVTKLSDGQYLRKLEACIRNGNALLIENVEEVLDPALEPVLVKALFKRGGQLLIRLGTEDVPYDENFGFFVTTKMANPHYLPEICIKVTVINFTVTLLGLEDQLVAEVVQSERPDLAQQRVELVVQIAADKKTQDDLEALILRLLDEAAGDVLKDDTLNETLDQSRKTGTECQERMEVADKAMAEIEAVRQKLKPVALRGSILYFVVADFANIDPMYQYSLEYFVGLFQDRLRESEKNQDVDKRIDIIIKDFTRFIYLNMCRGLFEDHKLLFSFLVTCQILRNDVHCKFINRPIITTAEWLFFLRGVEAAKGQIEEREDGSYPPPDFVPANVWHKLDTLERLTLHSGNKSMEGFCEAMKKGKGGKWEKFCTSDDIHLEIFPAPYDARLSPFMQMLVVKSIKENLLNLAARNVVSKELGDFFTESPPFDLLGCYQDSKATSPLIFVLSAGADPTEYLLQLAAQQGFGEKLHFISLGQGQGPKAEALVKLGWDTGDWVCLQNCHLAASWMPRLEALQESQDPKKVHEDYRLWLTSMPSPVFPVPVLQSGVKITNEPPKGLKANVSRTFQDINEDIYESCASGPSATFKKLLFGLAFFHAVILERRKFGPIGWNIPYEWMDTDFQISREQCRMYLVQQADVPWITLRYIIAEVNYGGRVTDDKDVTLISAVLKSYFTPEMLAEGFRFRGLDAYKIPEEGTLEECRQYLRTLPLDEDPRIFGLHQNALITAQHNQAKKFIDTVISVQPRIASAGGGKSPEEIVDEMASNFLERIPKPPKAKEAHADTYQKTPQGGIISIGVFHGQEYTRFCGMVSKINASLVMLGKALKGIVLMGAELEGMYNSFQIQKVPGNWIKIAYPCLKPLNSWMVDFILRIEFMSRWLLEGPPTSFWLSSFFFPQGFMTSALQLHARATKIAIDTLAFFSQPTDLAVEAITKKPDTGVYMHGLFIMGAGWDFPGRIIRESHKDILYELMPVIWLEPSMTAELPKRLVEENLYSCPLYKTSERKGTLSTTGHSTNFVKYYQLKQPMPDASHWTARGVALLCMLDE